MFSRVNGRGKGGGDSLHWTSFLFNTEKKIFAVPVCSISVQYVFLSRYNYVCIAKEIRKARFLFGSLFKQVQDT